MKSSLARPISLWLFTSLTTLSFGLVACGSEDGDDDDVALTFDEQVEEGGALYGEYCSDCHGDAGQGTDNAPALVGEGALPEEPPEDRQFRTNSFNTAADIYVFADEYMPANDPESVSDAKLIKILAFALHANGIDLDEPLTLDNADEVVIHE